MADTTNEIVIMEGIAGYGLDKKQLGKLGKFYLTNDTIYIRKVSQVVQTICMLAGVIVAIIVVNKFFGSTSRDYIGAALKGSFTGLGGALVGLLVSKIFPKQIGEIVFSYPVADVTSVEERSVGVRPVLEVTFKNGSFFTAALPNRDEWTRAIQRKRKETV